MKTFSKRASTPTAGTPAKKPSGLMGHLEIKETDYLRGHPTTEGMCAPAKKAQTVLNFGQRMFTTCHVCGTVYSAAEKEDGQLHQKLHRRYLEERSNRSNQSEEEGI
ncbi:hypothetical protein NEDG_01069 [Nematocida displodere]|uniref:N-acetyltransferase ESCO zinc-finger domain-containing protein n=1 Tax=Nematocida displodere TaxID=1805483 RepID=A0A177EC13_9MICR|nr:hypothetical protein NEDG_01069 [Nematocida displodere]